MAKGRLPAPFGDLDPFIDWAIDQERQRTERKISTPIEEIRAFYSAVFPRLDEIVAYLDRFADGEMSEPAKRLYHLSLSLVEVANLVELYKHREVIEACDPMHFNPQQ